jgi:hypothetical protein
MDLGGYISGKVGVNTVGLDCKVQFDNFKQWGSRALCIKPAGEHWIIFDDWHG